MNRRIKLYAIVFLFITIFEPPFLPIPLIYIQGLIEILTLLLLRKNINWSVLKQSKMAQYALIIFIMWFVISINRLIDIIFFNGDPSFNNWLKSTNQFLLITSIEFLNIYIFILFVKKNNLKLEQVLNLITDVGALQGLLSLLAYVIPTLRELFLAFAGEIYENSWLLQRRGYGFSFSLLDGFGFGMGIIAGLMIINFKVSNLKSVLLQLIKLAFVIFSVTVNSRTGLIIIAFAFLIKLCIHKSLTTTFIMLPIVIFCCIVLVHLLIPLLNAGMASSNLTISWISSDIGGLIKSFYPSADINTTLVQAQNSSNAYYTNISDIEFPDHAFQILFGKGWQVYYGTALGYRSDNGFVNDIWLVGVIGTIIYYAYNLYVNLRSSMILHGKYLALMIFNFGSIIIYSLKGRPFGYSPGIVVFYLIIFTLTYYGLTKSKDENDEN